MIDNYYKVLGIVQTASIDEIKRAYRVKSKQYHPDLNPSFDAKEKLQKIQEAYDTLSNEHLRIAYDMKMAQFAETKQIEKNFHYDFSSNYPSDNLYGKRNSNYQIIIIVVGIMILMIAAASYFFLTGNSVETP